mgnify:CR=1 FL=1
MSKRKKYTAEEKLRILEEAQQPGVLISEVCRRHGISSSMYYRWEKQMRAGARKGLAEGPGGKRRRPVEAEIDRLKAELARKNDVIAELTEALIQEKKGLSDYLRPSGSRRR